MIPRFPLPNLKAPKKVLAREFIKVSGAGRTKAWHVLAEAADGEERAVVVKRRNGDGMVGHGLACEMVAALLALDLAIPVQPPLVVEIDQRFVQSLHSDDLRQVAEANLGPNFGTPQWDAGFDRWYERYPTSVNMRQTLGEILGFDAMIQNVDRRRRNPNCVVLDERIIAFDHELAFSGLVFPSSPPPWEADGLKFLNEHAFRRLFLRQRPDLSRLNAEVKAITRRRVASYMDHVPLEWTPDPVLRSRMIRFLEESLSYADSTLARVESL
jgi:hypothetical protein